MRYFKLLAILAVVGLVAWTATPAEAAFKLSLDDNAGSTLVVADGDAADTDARQGVITVSASLGIWDISITAAFSKPTFGSVSDPKIDIMTGNGQILSSGGGTLTVMATDTDFGPVAEGLTADLLSAGGTAASGASVDVYGYLDTGNVEFGTEFEKPKLLDLGPGAFSGSATAPLPQAIIDGAEPFSMTLVIDITHTAPGLTTLDAKNEMVPEPATCLIWGMLGVIGLAVCKLRRRSG